MANIYRKASAGAKGEDSFGFAPPNPKRWQKLWKKNCTKSVGYTFRLKNYVKLQKLAAVSLFDPDPQISLQLFAQARVVSGIMEHLREELKSSPQFKTNLATLGISD